MHIDLAVLSLKDVIVPFASAFAGAYFAYNFNVCSENKKNDDEKFKQFNMLLNQINTTWMALMNYKIVHILKVEELINKNPEEAIKQTIYPPNVFFNANLDNNIFLAKYNFQLLPLLSEIEKQTFLTQETINLCQTEFTANTKCLTLTEDNIHSGIETFNLTKHCVDKSLAYLLLLREKLLECKEMYFKFLYLDNRDIILNSIFDNLIPNINSFIEVSNFSKMIDKSWAEKYNIFDYTKLHKDKIKYKITSFCKFMGLKK